MTLFRWQMIGLILVPIHLVEFILTFVFVGLPIALIGTAISGITCLFIFQSKARTLRLQYIEEYTFPSIVLKKFMAEHPYLSTPDVDKVVIALKQFFMAFALTKDGGKRPKDGFLMPSRIADELWHHFMLDSSSYAKFCDSAYGKMFHHKPGADSGGNANLRNMKAFSKELLNTYDFIKRLKEYDKLNVIQGVPILFAIDAALKIPRGFYYDSEVMNNISSALSKSITASDSSSTGGCGGLLAPDTMGSCSSGSSDGGGGGGCGGGCGGD